MNHLNKFFKIFLAFVMLGLQLIVPLATYAFEVTEDQNDGEFLDFYDDDDEIPFYNNFGGVVFNDELDLDDYDELDLDDYDEFPSYDELDLDDYDEHPPYDELELNDDEFELDLEPTDYYNETSDQPLPAITGYVPELLFADDMLQYIEEEEIFEQITTRNAASASAGAGLVQFVLEPVASSLPAGVTMAQARAAAFNASTMTHPLFANGTTNSVATIVNGRFGRDAIFLGVSANGNRYRVMIAGFEGYVNRTGPRNACNGPCRITVPINNVNHTFEVRMNAVFVPFGNYPSGGNVQSASHYVNRDGNLYRYLTNNTTSPGGFARFVTGPAPRWMTQNTRYYSYDGVFFYRNPRNIRANGRGAVNANNPFFNYFQYLSFRSNSRVTARQLDNFLYSNLATADNRNRSALVGQGVHFIDAQNRYGVNALLSYSKALHESGRGLSSIAINNNNVFGLNAVDSAPGQNASVFSSIQHSVNEYANNWMSRGYLWPGDWRYEGPHAGHKGSGMNVRFASDPYWGQKVAGWAFRIDRTLGNQDANREQIAIRQNTSSIAVANAGGATLYTANPRQRRYFSFLVTGNGTNNRLRILTDPPIVGGVPNQTALFNRNNAVGYIPNNNVWITGASNPVPVQQQPSNHQITRIRQTGVTRRSATFREGPGSSYATIRTVRGNTNLRITGRTNSWYRVVVNGTTGWLRRSAVARTRQNAVVITNNAHVRAGRGNSYSSLTQLPRGQRVTVRRRTGNWSRVTVNGHTGWIRNSDLRTTNAMRPGRTIANNVAVHARPRSNSNVRHTLPRHAQLMIVQRTTDGWSQVRIHHNGGILRGWVRTNQIETRIHSRRLVRDGALRSGPSTNFNRTRTIPRNTSVTVRSRVGNWYHVHVNINGRRHYGWLHRNNLRRLPLP